MGHGAQIQQVAGAQSPALLGESTLPAGTKTKCTAATDTELKTLFTLFVNDPGSWFEATSRQKQDLVDIYRRAQCLDPTVPLRVEIERFATTKGLEQRAMFISGTEDGEYYKEVIALLVKGENYSTDEEHSALLDGYLTGTKQKSDETSTYVHNNSELAASIRAGSATLEDRDRFALGIASIAGFRNKVSYSMNTSGEPGKISIMFRKPDNENRVSVIVDIDRNNKADVQYVVTSIPIQKVPLKNTPSTDPEGEVGVG